MQSGKLRNYVWVQQSIDGVWTNVKRIYVGAKYTAGNSDSDFVTGRDDTNAVFRARYDSSITTKMRFILKSRPWYIEGIAPDDDDANDITLRCVDSQL